MLTSGSTFNSPLSPRLETTSSNKCKTAKAKVLIAGFFCCLTAFLGIALTVYFTGDNRVDSTQSQLEFEENAEVLHLGDFSICDWEQVPVSETVLVNGQVMNFTTPLIQGQTCDTGESVFLVFGTNGVHGSIGSTRVTAESQNVSRLDEEDMEEEVPGYDESPKTLARAKQWRHDQEKFSSLSHSDRRQLLTPGLVDVHLHLDLDKHMTDTLGPYGASEYAVELVAAVNRDVYYNLGFNLKVVSINLRDSYVSESTSTSSYLDVIQAEGLPENVNLVHSLTTRNLGGGIAYLSGLYSPSSYGYGVSGSLRGEFNKWDLVVVAHELGHNFGASHTHDMTPQPDNCGNSCPADASGATIMSYCHLCSGGLNNIDFVFHEEVKEDILQAHSSYNSYMAERKECTELNADFPDVGVPFYLKTNQCIDMANDNPTLCELDSAWVRDSESGPFRLVSLLDRNNCWEANCGLNRVELASCSDAQSQRFEFADSQLRSVACASAVTGTNDDLVFSLSSTGTSALKQWCSPDSPTATPSPTEAVPCDNSNNGATDPYGDDCLWYDANPNGCGKYDDSDFQSNEMCCSCGGGVDPTQSTTEEPSVATQQPSEVTQEPSATTSQPTQTTSAEPSATSEPSVATQQPSTTPQPTETTQEPSAATAEPSATTSQPTQTTSAEPSATSEPTVATQQPSTTPQPTQTTQQPSTVPGQCEDSNDGATDPWNDDCSWYEANPWGCGNYNDNDFRSDEMCCVCGGGRDSGVTPAPTMVTPPPSDGGEEVCYISDCGCAPFLQPWCDATAHRLHNWCGQSKANCQACNGAWCSSPSETTFSPTIPATTTSAPTTESPTTTTSAPTTASPTTESPTTTTFAPTTASPTTTTTSAPTTANPTTSVPTTTTEISSTTAPVRYEEASIPEGKTCRNTQRIALHCRGRNACSQSFCQQLCDDTENCFFYFFNQRGRCHLFNGCTTFRRPTTQGVTMQKIVVDPPTPSTTDAPTLSTDSPTLSTTDAPTQSTDAPWEQGVKLTHFWDCNGMACDAPTLQPWDLSKYVASPGYSPQNPDNHGGAVYGEKMWLVGAASDSMSELLGEHDPCCGSSTEGSGCGKCVLMRVTDAVNNEWTALVMKKNRCPPWSNGCEPGNLHFDMAIPGYDNLQFSTANVCGMRDNTGFASQQASAVLGDWYNQFDNTIPAGASLCSTLPPQFQEGCELFSSWGWKRGDPQAEYRVVDCPEAFKSHVAAQFDASGVTSF